MAARRRRARTRADRLRGTIRLGVIFSILVGINVYVFLFRSGNLRDLSSQVSATRIQGGAAGDAAPALGTQPPGGELGVPVPAGDDVADDDGAPRAGVERPGKVARGDSLKKILQREGLEPPEVAEVLSALREGGFEVNSIREGQSYVVRFDDQGRLVGFELRISAVVVYVVERGDDDHLSARKAETKTEVRVEEASGRITSTLYDAVKASGESTELVAILADLFAYDINFFIETRPGDRFAVVVEKVYMGDTFYRYGKVLAAEYSGRVGTFRAFWWQPPDGGRGAYYDEKGQNCAKSMLKTPLKFARVSSNFNPRRMHPILHRVRGHYGTDFAAPVGTPVWASAGGKVTWAAYKRGPGNLVVIDHGNGLVTHYMHLSRFAKGLRAGQRVAQKQVIGYVGSTGLSTGPHLHFGVKQNGSWIDSRKLKILREAPVPKKHLEAFRAAVATRVAALERMTATLTANAQAATNAQ